MEGRTPSSAPNNLGPVMAPLKCLALMERFRPENESQELATHAGGHSGFISPTSHKYGNMATVKTTLEIPDFVFRRAKSVAAERGIPLRQFVTEAVQEKLKTTSQERPWMKHLGKLKHLRRNRKRVERRVEEAFEHIDREIWQ